MSESTRFCPFCGTEIQLDQTNSDSGSPIKASAILKGVGVAVAVPCAVATLAGFGAGGIVAGSVATMWQASLGNVAAGSSFATLQSIGATGGFYSGLAYGGTAFGAGKLWELKKSGPNQEDSSEKDGGDGDGKNHGSGENKNSAETTESEPDDGDTGEVSLVCPHCERTFTISVPTSGTTTLDEEVERIAQ